MKKCYFFVQTTDKIFLMYKFHIYGFLVIANTHIQITHAVHAHSMN